MGHHRNAGGTCVSDESRPGQCWERETQPGPASRVLSPGSSGSILKQKILSGKASGILLKTLIKKANEHSLNLAEC